MGISTDAYLYYGVDIFNPEEDVEIPRPADSDPEGEGFDCLWDLDRWLSTNYPLVWFGTHCSSSYPYVFLAVRAMVAERGSPMAVEPETMGCPVAAVNQLKDALHDLGLTDRVADIGWWLASYTD